MDGNMTLLLTGILVGVGCTLILGWLLRPRPKQAAERDKVTDPLTVDFRKTEAERQKIVTDFSDTYLPVAAGILIVMGVTLGAGLFGKDGVLTSGDNGYFANVFTELVSILVTVFVIDRLNRRRDEQRKVNEEKAQLLRDVRSKVPDNVASALHEMRERGWWDDDGLLKGADLRGANLSGTNLWNANLNGANLRDANLSGANLRDANLSGANLRDANLSGADLTNADLSDAELLFANLKSAELGITNLKSADLRFANLKSADLRFANLSGTILGFADLSGAKLRGAKFEEATELPDGTRWTADTDLARFTDPQHPDFWRSDEEGSPAFRGA